MLSAADVLSLLEEQKTAEVRQLAKKLEISSSSLKEILKGLAEHKRKHKTTLCLASTSQIEPFPNRFDHRPSKILQNRTEKRT